MDFTLDKKHEMARQLFRDFAEKEVKPLAIEVDETEEFPRVTVDKMIKAGFMGIPVPKEYGGQGCDPLTYAMCVEELSKVCGTTGVIVSAHTSLCCDPIMTFGTEEQKQKFLVPLAKGEKLGAFGLTEPGAGTDAQGQQTKAVLDGDEWVLNGSKCFITNGKEADVYVIFAVTGVVEKRGRKMKEISYDEMLELATSGAKVLHNRSVEMAKKYGVELVVRSSLNTEEGTLEQRRMESRHILMFRGKIIQDGHTFYVYLRKDVQSVLEVIEGTRLYLAVVLLLMVGLSYFLEKMSKASTEKKAKQSDYQLLESQREFVANISHELKTPLAVVSSQVEMLEIAGDKIDRSYYYSSIHEELDKMSRMVGELLDFSMLDNQMSSMEMSRVNVSEMIEYLLLRYDAMFRKNEIKVEQEIEKNCFAYGNRMYLERAVNNYLMNAFQHTEQGKRIRITLKKEKKQIRMEVYNDGEQIKEEQMEHIWDSFYTTSQKKKPVTSENEVRNIGLGLFVVRKIVDKHKGSCGAQNMENGVLFWLQLPEIRDLGK